MAVYVHLGDSYIFPEMKVTRYLPWTRSIRTCADRKAVIFGKFQTEQNRK